MNRSKRRHSLCTICSFRDDLIAEHEQDLHVKVNPSCDLCKPRHREELESSGANQHARQLLNEKPLTLPLAKFLLLIDRKGLPAATKLGPKGSHALIRLKQQGHVSIEWYRGSPHLNVSARSRRDALDIVAEGNVTTTRRESPRDVVRAPKRAAASSHANCDHESTPKARAKCRAQRAASQ